MNKSNAKFGAARQRENRESGFSLIELMVVIMIILIVSVMAIISFRPAIEAERANAAMRQVVEQLRGARELAVANRRWVAITFPSVTIKGVTESRVQAVQKNSLTLGAGPDVALPPQAFQLPMTYTVSTPDTPDGFGNAGPIVFGGIVNGPVGGMMFDPNGELVNGTTFLPINGSVFLGIAGRNDSIRAVTVMGTTGRVRGWTWTGANWVQF